MLVDLDDGVASLAVDLSDVVGVNAVLLTGIEEGLTVIPDHTALVSLDTGLCQRDRLVHAFTAEEDVHIQGGFGFTGLYDVVDTVDMVQIHGANVQNSHGITSGTQPTLSAVISVTSTGMVAAIPSPLISL